MSVAQASAARSRPAAAAGWLRLVLVGLPAAALDAALLWLAWRGLLAPLPFLVLHGVLGFAVLCARAGSDRAGALLAGLGLLLLGPAGALLGLAVSLGAAARPSRRADLDRWHLRLSGAVEASPAEALHREITDGRAFAPRGAPPPRFADVMAQGGVAQRQAVLGLLVKTGVEAPPALLASALRSGDVAVRASAAAAVAKLRERSTGAAS